MEIQEMDNLTFLKHYAEQKAKAKQENKLLYEFEAELEKRLNEGRLTKDA